MTAIPQINAVPHAHKLRVASDAMLQNLLRLADVPFRDDAQYAKFKRGLKKKFKAQCEDPSRITDAVTDQVLFQTRSAIVTEIKRRETA